MKLLLTAFEPFGGENVNPGLEAIKWIPDQIGGIHIVKTVIPTVFGKSIDTVIACIDKEKPDVVLSIGQAGGRKDITIERIAININDARIPDNEEKQPVDEPIVEYGPAAYFSNLPIKAMVQAIRDVDIPASVSNTAGTFVCNHLMYGVLHHLTENYPNARGGFIHVPLIPKQVVHRASAAPSMNLEDIVRGIVAAIAAIESLT